MHKRIGLSRKAKRYSFRHAAASLRKIYIYIVILLPVLLFLLGVFTLIVFFFSQNNVSTQARINSKTRIMHVGIFISPEDQEALKQLKLDGETNFHDNSPKWQVFAQYTGSDSTAYIMTSSYGPLLDYRQQFGSGLDISNFRGTLSKPVSIAFMFPSTFRPQTEDEQVFYDLSIMSFKPIQNCATWKEDGVNKRVKTTWLIDDGYPPIALCNIPAIKFGENIEIGASATQENNIDNLSYLRQRSFAFQSPLSLVGTLKQNLPPDVAGNSSLPFELRVDPHLDDSFITTSPEPDGHRLTGKMWQVNPGGSVFLATANYVRINQLATIQQFILLAAGVLLGLIPASLPLASRSHKRLMTLKLPRSKK